MKQAIAATLVAAASALHAQPHRTTLESLRHRQRVLLIFANGDNDLAELQLKVAAQNAEGFRERDLILVGLQGTDPSVPTAMLAPTDEEAARKRFSAKPQQFTAILIGKDGGEKLRSTRPIPWQTLESTIDSMPMRQDEMRRRPR